MFIFSYFYFYLTLYLNTINFASIAPPFVPIRLPICMYVACLSVCCLFGGTHVRLCAYVCLFVCLSLCYFSLVCLLASTSLFYVIKS